MVASSTASRWLASSVTDQDEVLFDAARPVILNGIEDIVTRPDLADRAVFMGLKRLPETHLSRLPRMADFALWATACETALWPAGTFWAAYCGNRDAAVEGVIEADPIAA